MVCQSIHHRTRASNCAILVFRERGGKVGRWGRLDIFYQHTVIWPGGLPQGSRALSIGQCKSQGGGKDNKLHVELLAQCGDMVTNE
jgi:hypothetical protein